MQAEPVFAASAIDVAVPLGDPAAMAAHTKARRHVSYRLWVATLLP
jgi:hypothetical protein